MCKKKCQRTKSEQKEIMRRKGKGGAEIEEDDQLSKRERVKELEERSAPCPVDVLHLRE